MANATTLIPVEANPYTSVCGAFYGAQTAELAVLTLGLASSDYGRTNGTEVVRAETAETLELTPAVAAGTAADGSPAGTALEWQDSDGDEIHCLDATNALPGVRIVFASGANGPGLGTLLYSAADEGLRWAPPGGTARETTVAVGAGGTFTVESSEAGKYVRVVVTPDFLPDTDGGTVVQLTERYGGFDPADVSAAEASAGVTREWEVQFANNRLNSDINVYLWLHADSAGFEISIDEIDWYSPTSKADSAATLGFITFPADTFRPLYVRKTFAAASEADPALPLILIAEYELNGVTVQSVVRGLMRVFNAAEYRIYRKLGADPVPGVDAAWATAASLPNTPSGTFADGEWHIAVTWFDGLEETKPLRMKRLYVTSGALGDIAPNGPLSVNVQNIGGGVVRITALAIQELGPQRPDTWAIWYTTDGSAPGSGSAQATAEMVWDNGRALLEYNVPAQSDGATVRAIVRTRRAASGRTSTNAKSQTLTARAASLDVAGDVGAVPGRPTGGATPW